MGGFSSPPPPGDNGLPDIAIPDFVSSAKQTAAGLKEGGFFSDLIKTWWPSIVSGVSLAINFLVSGIDEIVAILASFLTAAQGTGSPGLAKLASSVLSDLLGFEVQQPTMQAAFTQRGRSMVVRQLGAELYQALEKEFKPPGGTLSPDTGVASAERFLGFLIEFAVRQGNLSLIFSLLPEEIRMGEGIREYGELLAKNLGLGRLSRRALQPLIQTVVADPLQWSLNKTYKPTLLSEAQAAKAYMRGAMTLEDFQELMARKGHNDANTQQWLIDAQRLFTEKELLTLVRFGLQDLGGVLPLIQQQGLTRDQAELVWKALQYAEAEILVNEYLHMILEEVKGGFLDRDSALTELDAQPLTDLQRQYWKQILLRPLSGPRKHLTEAEVEKAYVSAILDLSEVQDYWRNLGYSDDSIDVLTILLLEKQEAAEAKEKAAAAKAARRAKKSG